MFKSCGRLSKGEAHAIGMKAGTSVYVGLLPKDRLELQDTSVPGRMLLAGGQRHARLHTHNCTQVTHRGACGPRAEHGTGGTVTGSTGGTVTGKVQEAQSLASMLLSSAVSTCMQN